MALATLTIRANSIRTLSAAVLALLMTVACQLPSQLVMAANYVQDEADDKLSRKGSVVKRWVKESSINAADKKLLEEYFDNYYFPALTQTSTEGLGELGDLRYELFRNYIIPATPAMQRDLTDKAFAYVKKVVRGRYHPSVKYNALLVLGSLGKSYSDQGTDPLPEANNALGAIVGMGLAKRQPPYVLAGGVIGLYQHALAFDKLPQSNQEATLKALVSVASQTDFADGASRLTKDWIRWRAATGLAEIAKKGGGEDAVSTLVKLMGDETLKLDTRCEVASVLPNGNLPDGAAASLAVLNLVKEAAKDEAKEAKDFQDHFVGGGGNRQTMQTIKTDRMRFDPETQRVIYIREGLMARLTNLQKSLTAVSGSAGDNAAAVQQVAAGVNKVIDLLTSRDAITDIDIADAVIGLSADITSATSGLGGAAAEEAKEEVDADLFE